MSVSQCSVAVTAGGGGAAGQAQAEPVRGLEQHRRGVVDLGALVAEPEDVAERVASAQRRRAAGAAEPAGQAQRSVAGHADRAAGGAPDEWRPARVHPDEGVAERLAVRADRNGPRPLGGDGDRRRRVAIGAGGQAAARGRGRAPPLHRRLLDPAARQHPQPHRLALAVEHAAVGERDQRDLGAAGAEVDGEDGGQAVKLPGYSAGAACGSTTAPSSAVHATAPSGARLRLVTRGRTCGWGGAASAGVRSVRRPRRSMRTIVATW